MADFPCMPFWTDAYLGDTQHLTAEEHGVYLLLLIQAWRSNDCSLADDDDMLSRFAKISPGRWKKLKPIIMAFWTHDPDLKRWVQKRLLKERKKTIEKSEKAKQSASRRWSNNGKDDANAYANASDEQCYPNPNHHNERSNDLSQRDLARKKSAQSKFLEAIDHA